MSPRTKETSFGRSWHTPCVRGLESVWIGEELVTKTLGILSVTLICVVVLTTPVRATAAAFVVTDPGTLAVLGTALVSVGLGTRKLFRSQKRKP
jgi:hypothetical protein